MRHVLSFACALLTTPVAAEVALESAVAGLDLVPCETSSLNCTTLTLPLDHFANDPEKTIDITFALSFAGIESRGILFYFVGGPGGSGVASADNYLASLDETLIQYADIVFVDQRGTGPVHGLSCPSAQAQYDVAPMSLDAPDEAVAVARRYVEDCTREMDAGDILPFVNTDQALRDSEAFRQAIGAPKVWLYGESYGTQLAQSYATAFPQAVRGVVLDGVVDLTLDAEGFYARYTVASERLLDRLFEECTSLAACRADMPGDPKQVYEDLDRRLVEGPLTVAFTRADGGTEDRLLTRTLLESSAFFALYSADGRSGFLRALAAAGRGDLSPLLHLGYSNLYIDPETQAGLSDPSWFSAAYFAITCSDYDSGTGTPEDRADAILQEAKTFAPSAPRLSRWYYSERLVCAFWPHQGPASRPPPFAGGDWPTLILNGDADPITPISMAYSVLDAARNAHAVFLKGGPHVIWGRGNACPDNAVFDLILDGIRPTVDEQHCEADFLGEYVPLTLSDPQAKAGPEEVAKAVGVELYQMIPLSAWDGVNPVTLGCAFGGMLTATATDEGTDYRFLACRFWPDLAVSGTAVEINVGGNEDSLILTLAVSGRHSGDIIYRQTLRDQAWSLSGTWEGQLATLPRLSP
jgi:pimeloyl-ACP methyl ester carboxylesterase